MNQQQRFSPGSRSVQRPRSGIGFNSKPQNNSSGVVRHFPQNSVQQANNFQPEQTMTAQPEHSLTPPANASSSEPNNNAFKPGNHSEQLQNRSTGHAPLKSNNSPVPEGGMRKIRAHGYKIHAGKAALEIKADEKMKARDAGLVDEYGQVNTFYTIRLEAALSNNSGDRTYDWQNKVALQLTDIELPLFIGVTMGFFRKIHFGNHGVGCEKSSKYFSVEHQGDKVFFQVGQKDKGNRPIPVNLPQANHIALITLEVYRRNFPGLDTNTIVNSIASMCSMYQSRNISEIKDRA